MKNLKLIFGIVTTIFFGTQITFSQLTPQKTWVTVNNINDLPINNEGKLVSSNEELQQLISEFNIISFEQALYTSKKAHLLKVYEVQCFCDVLDLEKKIIETSNALSNPQAAPVYDLMSEPDDYLSIFPNDYALDIIDAKGAWDYSTGDPSVTIGISDGNFYLTHAELAGEFVSVNVMTYTPSYYYNHGTAVAVTAAGKTNNANGKSAIGYDCSLALASMGYNYVMQMSNDGVPVINMSWAAGCYYSSYIQDFINEIYENGTILIAAAGNGGTCGGANNLVYPAAFDHVISVTSIGAEDNHERIIGDPTTTHQHNSTVDLSAPGYGVGITVAPGYYIYGNGSSFAAPYVAGTVGLMLSIAPCLSFEDVEYILKSTADNIDAQNANYLGGLGAGRLNARAAVEMASTFCSLVPSGSDNAQNEGNGLGNGNGNGNNGNGLGNGGSNSNDSGTFEIGGDGNNGNGNDEGDNDPSNPGNGPGSGGTGGDGEPSGKSLSTDLDLEKAIEDIDLTAKVFPNPTAGVTTVNWNIDAKTTITVIDFTGKIISREEFSIGTTQSNIELNQAGIYMILIEQEGKLRWSRKIVKL